MAASDATKLQQVESIVWVIAYRTLKGKGKGSIHLAGVTGINPADAKANFKRQTDMSFEKQAELCKTRGDEILCLRGTLTVEV